jgi:DNA-binding transcriptional regulator YdaS (Cro superfamily)
MQPRKFNDDKQKSPGAIKLAEYLKSEGETQLSFARRLGVSHGLIYQWLHDMTKISPRSAVRIERLTGGKLTRLELRPDLADVFS